MVPQLTCSLLSSHSLCLKITFNKHIFSVFSLLGSVVGLNYRVVLVEAWEWISFSVPPPNSPELPHFHLNGAGSTYYLLPNDLFWAFQVKMLTLRSYVKCNFLIFFCGFMYHCGSSQHSGSIYLYLFRLSYKWVILSLLWYDLILIGFMFVFF